MTMEETYRKISESEELRNRYTGITDAGALEELLEELGCRESAGEFMKYVKIKSEGEIPDADVENVAGGANGKRPPLPPLEWGKV